MSTSVSIGIMAYNEEKNIDKLLQSIMHQKLKTIIVKEIIVISSGSTDKTESIVKRFAQKNKIIKLVTQKKRRGKSSAVNLFIRHSKANIIVLTSADLILKNDTLEQLVKPLKSPKNGIVGCHPIPINNPRTFTGFAAHILWKLHHEISLKQPKLGEMIAFRKVFKKIPILSAVDEANIEPLIRGQGYKAVYAPQAIVYNKGPEIIHEFITARRRVYAGHLATKHEYSYEVSTLSGMKILWLLLKNFEWSPRFIFWTPAVIFLEMYSRFLGYLDYRFKLKNHTIWDITPSTKKLS